MEYRSGFHDFIKIRGGNEMADRNYIFRVLAHASFDKMKSAINAVHEKTGRNKFFIFLDMVQCTLRYGAGYYDYQVFAFII